VEVTIAKTDSTEIERGQIAQRGQEELNQRARKAAVQVPGKALTAIGHERGDRGDGNPMKTNTRRWARFATAAAFGPGVRAGAVGAARSADRTRKPFRPTWWSSWIRRSACWTTAPATTTT
jgi:hypothetical protein